MKRGKEMGILFKKDKYKKELSLINITLSNETSDGKTDFLTHIDSSLVNDDFVMDSLLQLNRYIQTKYLIDADEILYSSGNEYLIKHCPYAEELLKCYKNGGYLQMNEINKEKHTGRIIDSDGNAINPKNVLTYKEISDFFYGGEINTKRNSIDGIELLSDK